MAEALVHLMQDIERHRQRTARLLEELAGADDLVEGPVGDLAERLRAGDRRLGQLVAELTDGTASAVALCSATAPPRQPPMNQEDRHAHALRPVP
jgi:hypothetical protein